MLSKWQNTPKCESQADAHGAAGWKVSFLERSRRVSHSHLRGTSQIMAAAAAALANGGEPKGMGISRGKCLKPNKEPCDVGGWEGGVGCVCVRGSDGIKWSRNGRNQLFIHMLLYGLLFWQRQENIAGIRYYLFECQQPKWGYIKKYWPFSKEHFWPLHSFSLEFCLREEEANCGLPCCRKSKHHLSG